MNNQSPLIPQGSNVEQKNQNRSRIKFAVMGVIAVNVVFFAALLVVGCKREQNAPPVENTPLVDTNLPSMTDTNLFPVVTNAPVALELPFVTPPAAATTEYKIQSGDTLAALAKKFGVSLKAIQEANPNVDPKKLQINQTIIIPAATAAAHAVVSAVSGAMESVEHTYTVKSGDTLTSIASHHGTTVKALRAANALTTDKIKVGQKLKIPVKASAPAPAPEPVIAVPAPAPMSVPTPAPVR